MAKIILDDGTEQDFNESDYITKADLEENYISKADLEENYVTKEKYDQKKKQAKEAFRQKDLAERAASTETEAELTAKIEEKVTFKAKHGFDEIPQEVLDTREKHPTLSWEEAYKISGLSTEPTESHVANPNPGRENLNAIDQKTEYSLEELGALAKKDFAKYKAVAEGIEKGQFKQI